MLIPCEKLRQWATSVEPISGQQILKFIDEAEAKMKMEVDAAKECLKNYGYKTYEDQKHKYHPL